MTFKGRLFCARPMLKLFSGEKFLTIVENEPQDGGFGRENGMQMLKFGFVAPNRHILAQNRVF